MTVREGMQALITKWRKDADDAPRPQSNEERGYSNALHDAADELAALLASPVEPERSLANARPAFDMEAAVEAASCAVNRWLDWCEANDEAPCARSGAMEALTAALPHLMSAAKKEGGEADNLQPDMEALRRDAERYRFLRTASDELRRVGRTNLLLGNFDEDLDKAIDDALATQRDTSEGGR